MYELLFVLALTTSAVIDGIDNKINPSAAFNIDLYSLSEAEIKKANITPLPRNLLEALNGLKKDSFAQDILGNSILNQFFACKIDKWKRCH